MEEASQNDEVKLEENDSQPETPTFGTIEYIFDDEYEELLSMAEMKILSNVEIGKEEEALGKAEGKIGCQAFLFSFREDDTSALQLQTKEQVIDVSDDENEESADKTSKFEKSMKLLNIEEKPEAAQETAKQTREAESQLNASNEESQSSIASTTLNGSRCGTIFNNTQDLIQDLSFSCFDCFENPSKKELKERISWKQQVFQTEEGRKRRRIRPLQYWNGESIRYIKANQSIIRYRKRILEAFVNTEDCRLIKESKTQIMGSSLAKGEITVPAHVSVRLNFAVMVRVNISKDYSLSICDNKLQIINQRGKSSLVLKNCLLTELKNTLDVDCTLHLKIYSELP